MRPDDLLIYRNTSPEICREPANGEGSKAIDMSSDPSHRLVYESFAKSSRHQEKAIA